MPPTNNNLQKTKLNSLSKKLILGVNALISLSFNYKQLLLQWGCSQPYIEPCPYPPSPCVSSRSPCPYPESGCMSRKVSRKNGAESLSQPLRLELASPGPRKNGEKERMICRDKEWKNGEKERMEHHDQERMAARIVKKKEWCIMVKKEWCRKSKPALEPAWFIPNNN